MKTPALHLVLLAVVACFLFAPDAEAATAPARYTNVSGTIFNDSNRNGVLDRGEQSGLPAVAWLYRVYPNGSSVKVGQVSVDRSGRYNFYPRVGGYYFVAVRFSNTFAVRTRGFSVSLLSRGTVRNVPFMTPQTARRYPGYIATPNPANLDRQQPVSPYRP